VARDLAGFDLLGEVAGDPVSAGDAVDLHDPQLGAFGVAPGLLSPRTAGVEPAALGGLAGDGRSPVSRMRSRRSSITGFGTGTADMRARV
jgi:hypothetical protein